MNLQDLTEAPHQWNTPEFRRWFGHSIVRDRNGNPQRVYHGTIVWSKDGRGIGDFDEFDRNAPRKNIQGRGFLMDQVGSWFTDNSGPDGAAMYAGSGHELAGAVYPCYLRISNPWRPRSWEQFVDHGRVLAGLKPGRRQGEVWGEFDPDHLRRWLVDNGHDGIMFGPEIHIDSKTPQRMWIALFPEQIKSAIGNRGTFDPNSPKITESAEEQLAALKQLGGRSMIPNPDWLARKQKFADEDADEARWKRGQIIGFTSNGFSGSVTCDLHLRLPTAMIADLPGLSNEHQPGPDQRGKSVKADHLRPDMKARGYDYEKGKTIFVVVNHHGWAWIAEGNNRMAVALELGIEEVPVNVRYFNGGELADGAMSPRNLLRVNRGVITEYQEIVTPPYSFGEVVVYIDPGVNEFMAAINQSRYKELRGILIYDNRKIERIPVVWDAYDSRHVDVAFALRKQGLTPIERTPHLEFAINPGYNTQNVAHHGMVRYGPVYGTKSRKFAETILAVRLRRSHAGPAV